MNICFYQFLTLKLASFQFLNFPKLLWKICHRKWISWSLNYELPCGINLIEEYFMNIYFDKELIVVICSFILTVSLLARLFGARCQANVITTVEKLKNVFWFHLINSHAKNQDRIYLYKLPILFATSSNPRGI